MIQNRKRCSKVVLKRSISGNFVLKSVQKCAKCDRTSHVQKRAARTHIPHTFQNGFRTHTHTCNRTSHVCVRARTFATHALQNGCRLSSRKYPKCPRAYWAQFVCPSPKVLDFNDKRLHWASVVREY